MIRTETAKRYGGTVIVPLTSFLDVDKKYVIQDAEIDGDKCVIIKEYKGAEKLKEAEIKVK